MKITTTMVAGLLAISGVSYADVEAPEQLSQSDFCAPVDDTGYRCGVHVGMGVLSEKEYDDAGGQIVLEDGAALSLEFSYSQWLDMAQRGPYSQWRATLWTADVDYTGRTITGEKVNTVSEYRGFRGKAEVGYLFASTPASHWPAFGVLAGIDFDGYDRKIRNSGLFYGYKEKYQVLTGRLGVSFRGRMSGEMDAYLKAGWMTPLKTKEDIPTLDLSLRPGRESETFAELGFVRHLRDGKLFEVTFSGRQYHYSRSGADITLIDGEQFAGLQPESRFWVYEARAGILF